MAKKRIRLASQNLDFGFNELGDFETSGFSIGSAPSTTGLECQTWAFGPYFALKFTLTDFTVTLVKNGTSTAGGGTQIYDFTAGLIYPIGGSSDLTVANAGGDGSFLASVGSVAAGTDGTLTSTEITFLPSTAATVSSGVGTCKMKSTVTIPTPDTPIDGSGTAVNIFLNSAINADGTDKETLTYSGTILLVGIHLGDN
jgi:hypothetical protein